MNDMNDLILLNHLLQPITDRLLKGETLEELAKSEEFGDIIKELNLTDSREETIEKGGFTPKAPKQGRSKAGLTYVQKQVTKEGRTFTQGFWIKTNDTAQHKGKVTKDSLEDKGKKAGVEVTRDPNREERRSDMKGKASKFTGKTNVQTKHGKKVAKPQPKRNAVTHTHTDLDGTAVDNREKSTFNADGKNKKQRKRAIGKDKFEGLKQANSNTFNEQYDGEDKKTYEKRIKAGKYSENRQYLHAQIVGDKVQECPKPKNGEKPKCIILGGGSASGKSCGLKTLLTKEQRAEFGTIDCDAFMKELPEYESLQGSSPDMCANMAHYEASDITSLAIDTATEEQRNFIWDGTCSKPDKYEKVIKKLREYGYDVEFINVTCDFEEAYKRNVERSVKEGREVPFDQVKGTHSGNASAFDTIAKLCDRYSLFDNNPDNKELYGQSLICVENQDGLHFPEAKKRFLAKASVKNAKEEDYAGDKARYVDNKKEEIARKDKEAKGDKIKAQAEKTRNSDARKQEKHDKYRQERKERLKNKAMQNVGKSEPMMTLEDFWKSMDNPMTEEELYKSVSGEKDSVNERIKNAEFTFEDSDISWLETMGFDKDDCMCNRPHPKAKEIREKMKGEGKAEDEEEE